MFHGSRLLGASTVAALATITTAAVAIAAPGTGSKSSVGGANQVTQVHGRVGPGPRLGGPGPRFVGPGPRFYGGGYRYGFYSAAPLYIAPRVSGCGWLKVRALDTGSKYWWRRYRDCIED